MTSYMVRLAVTGIALAIGGLSISILLQQDRMREIGRGDPGAITTAAVGCVLALVLLASCFE